MVTALALAALALGVVALIVAMGAATRVVELEKELRSAPGAAVPGLQPGSNVPDLALTSVNGDRLDWDLLREGPTLALFVSPDCHPCTALMPALPTLRERHPEWQILLLARGEKERIEQSYAGLPATLALDVGIASDAFGSVGTPQAFLLRADHVVARGHPNSLEHLEALIEQASQRTAGASVETAPAG